MKGGIGQIMKQAQKMQADMQKAQEEMASLTVNGESGAGMVRITLTCKHQVQALEIDDSLVGDDKEVLIFDAAHDHRPIVEAVGGRRVSAIVCTHGHNDHINAAVQLRSAVDAPILLHPADRMLWDVVYPDSSPDGEVVPGSLLRAGGQAHCTAHGRRNCAHH